MEEIKPIPNQNSNNRRKYLKISIPLAVMVALVGGVFLTVNNALNQQTDNRSRASGAGVNLLSNPGCEGTSGFIGYQASLSTDSTIKRSGNSSCRLVSTGGSFYDIESTQSFSSPQQGQVYTGMAYVRAASNTGGKVYVSLRERGGSTSSRSVYGAPVTLTTNWQLVKNTMVVQNSGRTNLDFYVVQDPGYSGQVFYVDDLSFYQGAETAMQSTVTSTGGTGNVTLTPTVDTYVSKTDPSTTRGSYIDLRLKGSTEENISYLKFDLSSVPAGSTITSAVLQLRTTTDPNSGSANTFQVTLMNTNSWDNNTTYNTRPSSAGTTIGSINASSVNTAYSYNLTASALQSKIGQTISLLLGNASNTDGVWFNSKETSYPPKLVLTYTTSAGITAAPTQVPPTQVPPTAIPTQVPATAAPTVIPTATPTPAPGVTVTVAPTAIATAVPTQVATPTQTPVFTPAPTSTPVPGSTTANVTMKLHGIGKGGDAVNPNSNGNFNPLHPQRNVIFDVYNVENQLVMTKQGTASFNSQTGAFSGNIDLGTDIASGVYTVKVKSDQYLRGLLAGIQTITKGQVNTMPSVTLVSGDINNDNAINIVDYNIMVGCYSDLLPPVSCNDINLVRADLNDDSFVNQFDYNLFIRELTNIGGQ